jgi:hypothetical protein
MRGVDAVTEVEHTGPMVSELELENQFRREDGTVDQAAMLAHINTLDGGKEPELVKLDATEYEETMYHVAMKIRRYGVQIRQSDFRIWPGPEAHDPPGTPWGQPMWRSVMLDAFWEGLAAVESKSSEGR